MRILKCPHCRSTNVTLDTGGQTGKYICKDCKYIGGLIIQKRIKHKKSKKGDSMCLFKICGKKITWANWQLGILKWACIAIGVLLGAYFAGFWFSILWLVWVVAVVFSVWALAIWLGSMKKKK
ncbi:TFIIB-type zinc ribbon-containing protein [Candidatus Woesearchaeota archaeon]|nr:TFIIB-type zinc ribbon-containing protein [Candidatus Woesearchaeota archaeon]